LQLVTKTNCLDWNTCIAFAVNFIKMGGLKNEVFFSNCFSFESG